METTSVKMSEFVKQHELKFSCEQVSARPDSLMADSARHFRCQITSTSGVYENKYGFQVASGKPHSFTIYFSQGEAHTEDPTIQDVLGCLALDSSGYENANTFEEWCSEYGYDTDSRKAEKTYVAVQRQARELKRILGTEAYEQLLWHTDEDETEHKPY